MTAAPNIPRQDFEWFIESAKEILINYPIPSWLKTWSINFPIHVGSTYLKAEYLERQNESSNICIGDKLKVVLVFNPSVRLDDGTLVSFDNPITVTKVLENDMRATLTGFKKWLKIQSAKSAFNPNEAIYFQMTINYECTGLYPHNIYKQIGNVTCHGIKI